MAIQITEDDMIDRGQPGRKLVDGTHEATILICEQYVKNSISVKVEVVCHPKDPKNAPEGPVILSTYLPAERTEKVRDLSRLAQFMKACGWKQGVFEEADQVGKPIRVVTRWTPSRDPQYQDRAEIKGFLPALPGQKPVDVPKAPAAEPDPFTQS